MLGNLVPPVLGLCSMVGLWAFVALNNDSIPGPAATWEAATKLFADPFYSNGPNDQGIGWNVLSSLQRVGIGFGFGLGFLHDGVDIVWDWIWCRQD